MRVCGSRLVLLMVWLLWDLGTGTPNHTRTHSSTTAPPLYRTSHNAIRRQIGLLWSLPHRRAIRVCITIFQHT